MIDAMMRLLIARQQARLECFEIYDDYHHAASMMAAVLPPKRITPPIEDAFIMTPR